MLVSDELAKDDNYIKLYKFTCSLPKEQSYMLSYLIDAERYITAKMPGDPSYFQCNKEGFIDSLLTGWSTHEITAAIKGLEKAGYLTYISKNSGFKKSSYVKLNTEAIKSLATEHKNLRPRSTKNLDSEVQKSDDNKELIKELNSITNNNKDESKDSCDYSTKNSNTISESSKNFRDILSVISNESTIPEDVRKELINYYENKKGRFTVAQVKAAIQDVYLSSDKNWELVKQSVHQSFIRSYNGFFPVVENSNNSAIKYKKKANSDDIYKPLEDNGYKGGVY